LSGIGNGVNGKKRIKVSREHWSRFLFLFLGFWELTSRRTRK